MTVYGLQFSFLFLLLLGILICDLYYKLSSSLLSPTGSFTKPLAHGFMAGYFFQPITVHDAEVLEKLIG